jgi:hypothetical protein
VGAWVVTMVLLSLFGLVLFFFRVEIYAQYRWLLLMALLLRRVSLGVFVV